MTKQTPIEEYKRTKILATVGPSSWTYETIREMILAGTNGFRLNFSHGNNEEKTEHIANFAVVPSMRGQGIGSAFLQRQIQLAREKGQKQCSLYVASSNPNAQRLYERLGFQVIGEVTLRGVPVHNRPPSLRQMELKL